jgi:hypothetical protein
MGWGYAGKSRHQLLGGCETQHIAVGAHGLKKLKARTQHLADGQNAIAAAIPTHYASEERIASSLERLGKPAAADFIRQKLPTSKSIRSGDLGEILATEYIIEQTAFSVPVKRLRWKDHRNMAMRGDDIIGIQRNAGTGRLRFLKAESKSRVTLAAGVLDSARQGLDKDGGLPSPHALSFISDRLFEAGQNVLVDAIDAEQLQHGIQPGAVTHLIFTFSGNDPAPLLQTSLAAYAGGISQSGVGVQVETHVDFVNAVYDAVMADAVDD